MRDYLKNACEEIDAALLSGDAALYESETKPLLEYIARWQRVIADRSCYYNEDGMLCNPDGSRSIFDDIDE